MTNLGRRDFFKALALAALASGGAMPIGFPREMKKVTYFAADYVWGITQPATFHQEMKDCIQGGKIAMRRAVVADNLTPIGEIESYWCDSYGNRVDPPINIPQECPKNIKDCPVFCSTQTMLVPV